MARTIGDDIWIGLCLSSVQNLWFFIMVCWRVHPLPHLFFSFLFLFSSPVKTNYLISFKTLVGKANPGDMAQGWPGWKENNEKYWLGLIWKTWDTIFWLKSGWVALNFFSWIFLDMLDLGLDVEENIFSKFPIINLHSHCYIYI